MKNLTAVILAAGIGKRFWPMKTHKVLFPFMGKPFVQWAVDENVAANIVVVVNPYNASSFSFLKSSKIVVQEKPTGMADALLCAEKEIGNGPLAVINADDISDPNVVYEVIDQAISSNVFGVIPAYKTESYEDLGYLELDRGKVKRIIEKPGKGNQPSAYAFMVSYFIRDASELVEAVKETHDHEKALSFLMQKHDFETYEYKGKFTTLKYPWHVLHVMQLLLAKIKSQKGQNVVIKKNVTIEGDVFISDNVTIYENTKIVGPCYIGPNTIIGNNNIIRESHIGANCVTGFNTDITRSYVGDNCWFHSNYVGDCVLEGNISMGSGTVLANLRLDEGEIGESGRTKLGAMIGCDVRIGVNASVMPGIKIGSNSMVGAGVMLEKDLESNSFAIGKTELLIKKNTREIRVRPYV